MLDYTVTYREDDILKLWQKQRNKGHKQQRKLKHNSKASMLIQIS